MVKKVVKMILAVLALYVIFLVRTNEIYASDMEESDNMEENFWEIYRGTTAKNFVTDVELTNVENETFLCSEKSIEDILIEKDIITLEETGRVYFIDVIGAFSDGTYENIANVVKWESSNPDIVSVYAGQIIAGNAGTAFIHVSYQGIEKEFRVCVEKTIDVAEKIEEILRTEGNDISMLSMTEAERRNAISIASEMVNMTWTPTQTLIGWDGSTFAEGRTVQGMPYSQTPYQQGKTGFLNSMSYSDFYTTYYSGTTSMPRYGNDCSGFLSISWGISRTTTQGFLKGIYDGTYSALGNTNYRIVRDSDNLYRIYNYDDVLMVDEFGYLAAGDALIKYGHTFMTAANSSANDTVYVYEQTPYKARYTSYTYETLAAAGYIPFTK